MQSDSPRAKSRHLAGWKRGLLVALLLFVGLAALVLLAGSPIAKSIINRKLAALPGYTGQVEMVKLEPWRGAAEIGNFVLHERGHEDDEPVARAKRAALVISWPALLRGKLGGSALVENPEITVVKRRAIPPEKDKDKPNDKEAKKEKAEEKKAGVPRWQDNLQQAFPLEISRLEIRDGRIRFIDRTHQPKIDISLASLHVLATGLGNRPDPKDEPLPAKVELSGITTGNGKLKVSAQADPVSKQLRFTTNFELREMKLPALNNFLLAYANADVARGTFELYIEINAANGAYEGYAKPFFKDLDFKTASDKDRNAAQLLIKKAVSAVASILKNHEEKKVAIKVPLKGNFADNKVDGWTAIQNLLSNAFLQALREGLEGQPTSR